MAWAIGCSEPYSTLAARRSSSLASPPASARQSVTTGLPRVRVPVLSKTITLMSLNI